MSSVIETLRGKAQRWDEMQSLMAMVEGGMAHELASAPNEYKVMADKLEKLWPFLQPWQQDMLKGE